MVAGAYPWRRVRWWLLWCVVPTVALYLFGFAPWDPAESSWSAVLFVFLSVQSVPVLAWPYLARVAPRLDSGVGIVISSLMIATILAPLGAVLATLGLVVWKPIGGGHASLGAEGFLFAALAIVLWPFLVYELVLPRFLSSAVPPRCFAPPGSRLPIPGWFIVTAGLVLLGALSVLFLFAAAL